MKLSVLFFFLNTFLGVVVDYILSGFLFSLFISGNKNFISGNKKKSKISFAEHYSPATVTNSIHFEYTYL